MILDKFEGWFNQLKNQKPSLTKEEFLSICEEELEKKFENTRKQLFSGITINDLSDALNLVKKGDDEIQEEKTTKKTIISNSKKR